MNYLLQSNSQYFEKSFLITGSFSTSRNEIKEIMINKFKASFKTSVTKNVDYVIAGKNFTESKIKLAEELGIPIIKSEF